MFRHLFCICRNMASKIIQFRPRSDTQQNSRPTGFPEARERAEALPDWLKELDVDWVFKAADERLKRR